MSFVQMTLSGGVFILFTAAVRALTRRRLPKWSFLALWEMAALRLLVPFAVPLPLGRPGAEGGLPAAEAYLAAAGAAALGASDAGPPGGTALRAGTAFGGVLPAVWLAVALLMAAYFAALYVRARRRFCRSSPDGTPAVRRWLAAQRLRRPLAVRRSALVSSPLTYGILRPVILLPKTMAREDEAALTHILTHELVHIRRFDAAAKLLFAAALCVHWFNPLAWVLYVLANRDMELSCDERVMDTLGGRARAAYALTLIGMEEAQSCGFSPCNHFGKLAIEERIETIMKYKKASVLATVLAVALVFGTTAAFAVSARADDTPVPGGQDGLLRGYMEADNTLISYVGPDDGKTYYSWDKGQTFEALTDEEFARRFPTPVVEWWTYDEYAAWLAQEKVQLQAMLGEKGWTGGRGDFVWTQEIIDETIAMYEAILQEIKEGALYSRSVDGDSDTLLISGGGDFAVFKEDGRSALIDTSNIRTASYLQPDDCQFGHTADAADKASVLTYSPPSGNIIRFGTKAELNAHLRALEANEEKGLDRYAGFEAMYAGIDTSLPVTYIIQ